MTAIERIEALLALAEAEAAATAARLALLAADLDEVDTLIAPEPQPGR